MDNKEKIQEAFFELEDNQYPPALIENPPFHTILEIKEFLNRLSKANIHKYIVDFGAGSGRLTIPLLKNNFRVLAIDVSNKSLRRLQKIAKKSSVLLDTSISLPIDRKFQTVVGADILHHIDLDKYLPKIYSSLEKGGRVIFSEPCAFNLAWYIYLPLASSWGLESGILNCSYYNLKHVFEKQGFRNVTISGLGFFPRPFFNWSKSLCKLNDWIGNLPILKLFAYRYIIEATK